MIGTTLRHHLVLEGIGAGENGRGLSRPHAENLPGGESCHNRWSSDQGQSSGSNPAAYYGTWETEMAHLRPGWKAGSAG